MPSAPRCRSQGGVKNRPGVKTTAVLSAVLVVLGTILIAETALVGGGVGYVLGSILALAGGLRLYLSLR
jgi:hypothetical protein